MGSLVLPPLLAPCRGAEGGGPAPGPSSSVLPPGSGAAGSAGCSPWALCWGPGPAVHRGRCEAGKREGVWLIPRQLGCQGLGGLAR